MIQGVDIVDVVVDYPQSYYYFQLALIVCVMISVFLPALKYLSLHSIRRRNQAFQSEIHHLVQEGRWDSILDHARQTPSAPSAKMIENILAGFYEAGGPVMMTVCPEGHLRRTRVALNRSRQELGEGMGLLATIAATGVLVGLAGTVFGLYETFLEMYYERPQEFMGIGMVARTVKDSLISTATGMLASFIAYWFYQNLQNRIDRMILEMEVFADSFVNAFSRPKAWKASAESAESQ